MRALVNGSSVELHGDMRSKRGSADGESYDLAIVGTGFAGTFFLKRWLAHADASARVLVLERGPAWDHARRIAERANSPIAPEQAARWMGGKAKPWNFTLALGGGTNCWWGNTPRMLPDDFQMRTLFGVGEDWPIGYDDLAAYYAEAETAMNIAGPTGVAYRTTPYPQPAHRLNEAEAALARAYPRHFHAMPTARARLATEGRGACCANGVCHLCPVDAKFTVENSLAHVYADPRVTLVTDAHVGSVDVRAGRAHGVVWTDKGGRERTARVDGVALAANAIFNPAILLRSGITHPLTGRRLHEQIGVRAEVRLRGLSGFDGSTSVTGMGTMLYDDRERRRDRAACLLETWNVGLMRREPGRWREVLPLRLVYEDLPRDENAVELDPGDSLRPIARFERHSDYAERAVCTAAADLERVFAPLPVEDIVVHSEPEPTEGHIMGTTVMATSRAGGVVDPDCVHHDVRNLLVLGSSTFVTGAPANPSLTIAAQSLRAADRWFGRAPAASVGS